MRALNLGVNDRQPVLRVDALKCGVSRSVDKPEVLSGGNNPFEHLFSLSEKAGVKGADDLNPLGGHNLVQLLVDLSKHQQGGYMGHRSISGVGRLSAAVAYLGIEPSSAFPPWTFVLAVER